MGEHTSFIMRCELKKDTPEQVIETLKYMVHNPDEENFDNPPEHPLFDTELWETILFTGGGALWNPDSKLEFDGAKEIYTLIVRTSVKDHEDQVPGFLHWIAPYSETEGFVGTSHPEYSPYPSRILFEKGHAFLVEPVENATGLREYTEPEEDNRYDNLYEHLQQLTQANPEIAASLKNQLAMFAQINPEMAPDMNDPQFKKLKDMLPEIFGKDEEKDS